MSILSRLRLAETKPRPDTSERGSSAVTWQVGSGPSRQSDPEYKAELRGRQGGRLYQRMRFSDPHIAGLRRAQNLPLLAASAEVEPADKNDKDAVAKAELIKRLLIDDFPFRAFLSDSLLAFDYGFAPFEIIWRIEGGETRFRLALRPASSITLEDVYVSGGAIDHVVQHPDSGGEFTIPGEKLVWFAHDKEGDHFTGRPILRPMYKPWRIKEAIEMGLSENIRKLGGIPYAKTTGQLSAELAAKLDTMLEDFGVSDGSFFRTDENVDVSLLTGDAKVSDALAAIQHENTEITSVCQAQVFDLGTSNSGSRALGTTLSDLFATSVTAQANYREDVLNAKGGLIHQCVAYNFPTDDNLPKLRFGNVQAVDMRLLAASLLAFSQADLPPELDEWARQQMNMPEGTTEQVVVPTERMPPAPASSKSPGPGADAAGGDDPDNDDPNESGAQASEHDHGAGWQLAELRKLHRAPTGVECYVELAEIDRRYIDAKTAVREATQATRDRLVAEVIRRASEAQERGQLAKFAAGAAPMVDVLTGEVRAVLADFYEAGRSQVEGELDRQKRGERVVEDVVQARQDGQRITAAEKKPKKAPVPDPEAALDVQADMVARGIADETKAAAATAAARVAAGTPLTPSAWTQAVGRASDEAALRLGLTVSDAMILGRSVVAGERAFEIEQAVYSALLDDATCSACEPMDGETTTDLDEAAGWCPNPECEGGLFCRCIQVYAIKQEATE